MLRSDTFWPISLLIVTPIEPRPEFELPAATAGTVSVGNGGMLNGTDSGTFAITPAGIDFTVGATAPAEVAAPPVPRG